MKDTHIYYRLLYIAIGLIATTALILIITVLPPTQLADQAIIPVWVNIFFQLLFIISIVHVLKIEKSKGQQKKELLVATGVILIFFALIISDGAFAFTNNPEEKMLCISFFMCVATDLSSGILTIWARYSRNWKHKTMS
nr:hypothetical protein [uncultured Carboxylicivirga sp.]